MSEVAHRGWMRGCGGVVPNSLALGYAALGHAAGLGLLVTGQPAAFFAGVLLTAHTMAIASCLIHEAARCTLFRSPGANRTAGEVMAWICGPTHAAFGRIRHMPLRHHRDRADVTVFDCGAVLRRHGLLRRAAHALEWAHVPAVELLMHCQTLVRPFTRPAGRDRRARVVVVLASRVALFALLGVLSPWALAGYAAAHWLLLGTLDSFDAFHRTFPQNSTDGENVTAPLDGRDRAFEQTNTDPNVISARCPWLNMLRLDFGDHNARHEQAAVPWFGLPALIPERFGEARRELFSSGELLRTYRRHRRHRVLDDDFGAVVGLERGGADDFIGAHGVSFLTVV